MLDAVMFVRFQKDTMVYPGQGEFFQDRDPSTREILTLDKTYVWKYDLLGLKTLVD